jgi:hypothetical protein
MAEIGPVQFARVAREVAETAVPQYRSPFSTHTFTQPSLLAILCLMRYEDWTYREAEVRLREHAELREALGLARVPDYTTLYRCLRRTNEDDVTRLLHETIRRMPPPPDGGTTVAVDGTGLAPGAISTFFVNRTRDRGEGFTWRHWLKWVVVVDLPRRLILAQAAKRGPTNDGPTLRPLLDGARHVAPIRCVLADGEFDSELARCRWSAAAYAHVSDVRRQVSRFVVGTGGKTGGGSTGGSLRNMSAKSRRVRRSSRSQRLVWCFGGLLNV